MAVSTPLLIVGSVIVAILVKVLFMGNSKSFQKDVLGASGTIAKSIFDFSMATSTGEMVNSLDPITDVFDQQRFVGATGRNYADLQALYDKYSSRGLEILAFPCNDFLYQERGTDDEIQSFVKEKGATFPVFGKIVCEYGEETNPLYKYLKYTVEQKAIRWNFSKFLCDRNGIPVKRFGTSDTFSMEGDIVRLLEDESEATGSN